MALETKFEAYLLFKASNTKGVEWLKRFQRGGLQTLFVIIHFLYDSDWVDSIVEGQEGELIHLLSPVKVRVFRQLNFSTMANRS